MARSNASSPSLSRRAWVRRDASGLLSRAHQNFTDEALRGLCHECGNHRRDVVRLQLLFWVLSGSGAPAGVVGEIRIDRPRSYSADADVVLAQFFGHRIGEAVEAPFRRRVGGALGK